MMLTRSWDTCFSPVSIYHLVIHSICNYGALTVYQLLKEMQTQTAPLHLYGTMTHNTGLAAVTWKGSPDCHTHIDIGPFSNLPAQTRAHTHKLTKAPMVNVHSRIPSAAQRQPSLSLSLFPHSAPSLWPCESPTGKQTSLFSLLVLLSITFLCFLRSLLELSVKYKYCQAIST